MGNQSGVIFGFLFVAYFVFITMRGELPKYAGFLLSTPTGGAAGSSGSNPFDANYMATQRAAEQKRTSENIATTVKTLAMFA